MYWERESISDTDLKLMRRMGITALYGKPNTSRRAPGHTIWPYLLRTLPITRSDYAWAMDITFSMARGFVYLGDPD